jgi:hypothetical protein
VISAVPLLVPALRKLWAIPDAEVVLIVGLILPKAVSLTENVTVAPSTGVDEFRTIAVIVARSTPFATIQVGVLVSCIV